MGPPGVCLVIKGKRAKVQRCTQNVATFSGTHLPMDWDSAYKLSFQQDLKYLRFESRPVKVFNLEGCYSSLTAVSNLSVRELATEGDVTRWLAKVRPCAALDDNNLILWDRKPQYLREQHGQIGL